MLTSDYGSGKLSAKELSEGNLLYQIERLKKKMLHAWSIYHSVPIKYISCKKYIRAIFKFTLSYYDLQRIAELLYI